MKRLFFLALSLAVASCDEFVPGIDAAIDATPIDAPPIDAPPIDAPPPATYGGAIYLLEAKLLNPGTSGTFFGQGLQISTLFTSSDIVPAPIMEEQPGSPLGCKGWVYTPSQAAAASSGLDEGTLQITATAGTNPPVLPACTYTAGQGYRCPHPETFSTGGEVAISGPGTATLTDADVTTYTVANTSGRYVSISGAVMPANNGLFPIVSTLGGNTITYGNPVAVAETLPAAAFHVNLAGSGPIPAVAEPGFLANDVGLTFALTAGGGGHVPSFTSTTGGGSVGDGITIATAEALKLNAIPGNGAAFTIACDGANCGAASGTLINIATTDAPLAGQSPFAMPPPVTRRVEVRCAALGITSITVPAVYSDLIRTSGATRIQAIFIRPTLMSGGPANVTSIAGHAIVGYTTR